MTLTFVLTDVEGSTRLWEAHGQAMGAALAAHDRLVSRAVANHGGRLVKAKGEGDSSFSVFTSPAQAVAAALELQRALAAEPWPLPAPLAVRVAVHAGEVQQREADFYGPVVNRCARLRAIGHGGQVLLSAAVAELVREDLPEGAYLRELGVHRLKDLAAPEHVVQLCHPDLPDQFPPLSSLQARPNNLPMQLTSFVGRERELAGMRQQLDTHRLVTLVGIGGCGKTRLALQAAADAVESYPDGVWLVELAPLSEPSLVEQQLATVLGIREEAGTAEPAGQTLTDRLVRYLTPRRSLVLLDNCEHLIEACAAVAARLVATCPDLTVLATSREPLGVSGEVTFGVPPLAVDPPGPAAAGGTEAVRLFVDRAGLVDPAFALTPENAAAVASICGRLDGIPLAIELAAARTRSLTPQQLDDRLGDRFRLLTGGSRTSLPHHQTLRAAIEWSHRLLSGPEQVVFRRLAVFAGGCTPEAPSRSPPATTWMSCCWWPPSSTSRCWSTSRRRAATGCWRRSDSSPGRSCGGPERRTSCGPAIETGAWPWPRRPSSPRRRPRRGWPGWRPSRTTSGRPWSGTAPRVTTGPSGCGLVGRCGSSGGRGPRGGRGATGSSGRFRPHRTRRPRPGPSPWSGPACWRRSRATRTRPSPSSVRARPSTRSWGTDVASPSRWSARARSPWRGGGTRRRGPCSSRRCGRLGPRKTSTWSRSRGTSKVAATLLGATELPRQASPAPHLGVREAGIAAVKAALDPDTLAGLREQGRAMPLDQAIAYALQQL